MPAHEAGFRCFLIQNRRAPASVIIAHMAIVSGILFIIAALGTVLASRLTFVGNRKACFGICGALFFVTFYFFLMQLYHTDESSRIVNAVIAAVATLLLLQLGAILFRNTRHRE